MSPSHAVIDGSNIATEGRSEPSLVQLEEAVAAFRDDYDFTHVTVIVDASFEHRVSKAEQKRARAEIESGAIITPPAGVIGRGDTFILQVAHRANAVVLSNDSFQEFHGTYSWLFDEGRLIGGKPVPGVGWIYVPRAPVRGPVSRRVTKAAAAPAKKAAVRKAAAKKPAAKKPVTKKAVTKKQAAKGTAKKPATKKPATKKPAPKRAATKKTNAPQAKSQPEDSSAAGTNPARAWSAFRRSHPEGSTITATVERFSSHGAYARSATVEVYIPLQLLADPPPRRSRDAVSVGETREFFVHRFDRDRRGIDVGIIATPAEGGGPDSSASPHPRQSNSPRKAKAPAKKAASRARTSKPAAKKPAVAKTPAKKAPAKKTAAKKAATKRATQRRR